MKAIVLRKNQEDILVVDEMTGTVYKLYRSSDSYGKSHLVLTDDVSFEEVTRKDEVH